MIQLSFFRPGEFRCPCCGKEQMDPSFLSQLDMARRMAGVPFHINSGFRCSAHNATLHGSVSDSSHLRGIAADISAMDSPVRYRIVRALMDAGFQRIGIGQTFIHVDADAFKPNPAIWTYATK